MPAAVAGIACKVFLLVVCIVFMIVIAAADNGILLYKDPRDLSLSDKLKDLKDRQGLGLFESSHGNTLDLLESINRLPGDTAIGCKRMQHAWRAMQAACILAILGLTISIIVTLTYLCTQDDVCVRSACSCIGDTLGIFSLLGLLILNIAVYKLAVCDGTWESNEDLTKTNHRAFEAHTDLSYGLWLTSVAVLFAFISVCIGLVSRHKAKSGSDYHKA